MGEKITQSRKIEKEPLSKEDLKSLIETLGLQIENLEKTNTIIDAYLELCGSPLLRGEIEKIESHPDVVFFENLRKLQEKYRVLLESHK